MSISENKRKHYKDLGASYYWHEPKLSGEHTLYRFNKRLNHCLYLNKRYNWLKSSIDANRLIYHVFQGNLIPL